MKNIFSKSLILFVFAVFPLFSFSQIFGGGFIFGVCGSQVDGDEQSGFKRPGILSGVYVDVNLGKRSSVDLELYYAGKGAVLNESFTDGTTYQVFKTSLRYIEFPIMYDFKITDKFSFGFGPAFSYLISSKLIINGFVSSPDDYTMNNFDFAPMIQSDFYLTDNILINVRYSHSSFSIRADDVWYNSNLSISLRYKLK
jgi:hypothetical protein